MIITRRKLFSLDQLPLKYSEMRRPQRLQPLLWEFALLVSTVPCTRQKGEVSEQPPSYGNIGRSIESGSTWIYFRALSQDNKVAFFLIWEILLYAWVCSAWCLGGPYECYASYTITLTAFIPIRFIGVLMEIVGGVGGWCGLTVPSQHLVVFPNCYGM